VGVAPAHQPPAAKAAVAAEGDADVGPDLAQACDEQFEDGGGVVIGTAVGGSQVRDPQLRAAEDVERGEAVAVVVAVEEAAFLVAVDGIAGGVEVEREAFGRSVEGGDELADEGGGESDRGRAVDAALQPAQRRRRGERRRVVGSGVVGGGLRERIVAEVLVVVEVFVAAGDAEDPLGQPRALG